MIILIIAYSCSSSSAEAEIPTRETVLVEMAKEDILKSLKSPSTAKFVEDSHDITQMKTNGEPVNQWRVRIEVDAQNAMGAEVRDRFTLVYKQEGDDSTASESYSLEKLFD